VKLGAELPIDVATMQPSQSLYFHFSLNRILFTLESTNQSTFLHTQIDPAGGVIVS